MSDGIMKVSLKDEKGMVLTKEHGFTIEENERVLAFDVHEHPELGLLLLFGDQVFALSFWSKENLEQGVKLLKDSLEKELERRNDGA